MEKRAQGESLKVVAYKIKGAYAIEEVISDYLARSGIELKKRGKEWQCCCPFHKEKTPSFKVNPAKQIYHCFGCHKGGDVITFAMEYEHLDFPEAVKMLAERKGIPVYVSEVEIKRENERSSLYNVLEKACLLYQKNLSGSPAQGYMKERGFTPETLAQFKIGYSPSENFLLSALRNLEIGDAEKAGLVRKSKKSGRDYDIFRNRVMFPIFDYSGRIIGFGARTLVSEEERRERNIPKYINSPETVLFQKGKILYGINFASRAIGNTNQIVNVEGYTDVMACHQSGIENAVAILGTAFTEAHIRGIRKRFPNCEIALCYDGDEAGIKAALRSGEMLIGRASTSVCLLPGKDPADILLEGGSSQKIRREEPERPESNVAFDDAYFDELRELMYPEEHEDNYWRECYDSIEDYFSAMLDPEKSLYDMDDSNELDIPYGREDNLEEHFRFNNEANEILSQDPHYEETFYDGNDDEDTISNSRVHFQSLLAARAPFFDFYLNERAKGKALGTLEGRLGFLQEITPAVRKVPRESRRVVLETISQQTGLSLDAITDGIFLGSADDFGNKNRNWFERTFFINLIYSHSREALFKDYAEKINAFRGRFFKDPSVDVCFDFFSTQQKQMREDMLLTATDVPLINPQYLAIIAPKIIEFAKATGRVISREEIAEVLFTEHRKRKNSNGDESLHHRLQDLDTLFLIIAYHSAKTGILRAYHQGVPIQEILNKISKFQGGLGK